ncbi:hypothetical protein Tco_0308562, partial [Tanacetum coccineum]
LRIEKYFQVQDYALWDVIENGNSFKSVPQTTTNADGSSTSIIPGPVTTKEKIWGNKATKKTQKTLLKQMYENFSASSTESLDSIFSRLQKIVLGNGYLRKGQKQSQREQNRAREWKGREKSSQSQQKSKSKSTEKFKAETEEKLNGPTRTHLMGRALSASLCRRSLHEDSSNENFEVTTLSSQALHFLSSNTKDLDLLETMLELQDLFNNFELKVWSFVDVEKQEFPFCFPKQCPLLQKLFI